VVPGAVLDEVGGHGPDEAEFQEIVLASWIRVTPSTPIPATVQAWDLGAGESAVLALALEDRDCEVILDDRDAKRCAQTLGISARGTLGLVLLSKQLGEVPAARPLVDQLKQNGLYLTEQVINRALALVGE
jgi:predicted nucleic acid-binding protein